MKQPRLKQIIVFAFAAAAAAAAGALQAQSDGSQAPETGRIEADAEREPTQAELDERTRRAVRERLLNEDDVDIEALRVEVEDGIVTLHGRVGTGPDKHLASDYASDLRGVVGVVNLIRVTRGMERGVENLSPAN